MERKITRITTQDYSDSQVLTIDADKQTIAQIVAFVAELNVKLHTPQTDPDAKQG